MAPDVPARFPHHHSFPTPATDWINREETQRLKCVLLGDGAVGKTSLIVSYTTNGYPTEYVPTAFDNYSVRVEVDNQPIRLQICDTAGQDDFDHMRPLCYPGTDVVLLCFSVVHPASLCNVREKWLPEIKKHIGKVPVVLVGTQTDLRSNVDVLVDLARLNEKPVCEEEALDFARSSGALCYVECSALTQKNLKQVFDTAILEAISFRQNNEKRRKKSWRRQTKTKSSRNSGFSDCTAKKLRRKSLTWWKKAFCFA